jgi:hypothetical protein
MEEKRRVHQQCRLGVSLEDGTLEGVCRLCREMSSLFRSISPRLFLLIETPRKSLWVVQVADPTSR